MNGGVLSRCLLLESQVYEVLLDMFILLILDNVALIVGLNQLHSDILENVEGTVLPFEEINLLFVQLLTIQLVFCSLIKFQDHVIDDLTGSCVKQVVGSVRMSDLH